MKAGGFKCLGVFVGTRPTKRKNWDNVIRGCEERVKSVATGPRLGRSCPAGLCSWDAVFEGHPEDARSLDLLSLYGSSSLVLEPEDGLLPDWRKFHPFVTTGTKKRISRWTHGHTLENSSKQ